MTNDKGNVMRVVIIDTETTGLEVFTNDRIIEIAAVEIVNGIHTDGIRLEKQGKSQDFIRENETTPAKRLGLVDKNFTMKDILEFSAAKETILEKRI
ncbi:hypothetical protein J8A87_25990 [Vibrio parahaemolyticus]|nr:hypothetical protein [Vibrio parahaemolyticus]